MMYIVTSFRARPMSSADLGVTRMRASLTYSNVQLLSKICLVVRKSRL